MNLPLFIARRIAFSGKNNFSGVIIRIAVVAVALSVAVMIAASALIAGFKYEIGRKIFEFWGHVHITGISNASPFEPTPIQRDQPFYPGLEKVREIAYSTPRTFLGFETGLEKTVHSRGGVRHIQVVAHKPGIIRTKTAMEGILLKGVGTDFDWSNLKPYLLEGRPLILNDSTPSRDIIISRQTADRLQVSVGDKFIVYFVNEYDQLRRLFQVCGIYKTGLEEYDRKFALCDLRQTQQLHGWQANEIAGFEVWLDDIRDLDLYNDWLNDYSETPKNWAFEAPKTQPDTLQYVSIRDKFSAIFQWLQLQDYNEVVILSLMLAVAIINMITALLVLVLERSNMIGILKALGQSNRGIRQVFLYYAAVIILRGMFWGNLLGLGFCWLQDRYHLIRLNEVDYYLSYAPVQLDWFTWLLINMGTLAAILLFLLLPSFVVSKISPVRAIRFE